MHKPQVTPASRSSRRPARQRRQRRVRGSEELVPERGVWQRTFVDVIFGRKINGPQTEVDTLEFIENPQQETVWRLIQSWTHWV